MITAGALRRSRFLIGDLRHEITIERRVEPVQQDDSGEPLDLWETLATVPAAVEPLAGREFFEARQHGSQIDHQITLRYLPGVLPSMRVRFGVRVFEIEAVLNAAERNITLHLMAKEQF